MSIGFLLFAWMFSFMCFAGNLATWTTRNMTNDYYYRRGKNGWWTIFWVIVLVGLSNYLDNLP